MHPFRYSLKTLFIICIIYSICSIDSLAKDPDTIIIGMSAAFSGPSKELGYELYNGMNAYFEFVNKNGGVNGKKIELIAYDDGYNPLPAINNTLKLIDRDNVFLLIGYVGTPTVTRVLPLLKIFEEKDIYLFFPFTGAEPQRSPPYKDYVFNLRPSYLEETSGLVRNLLVTGNKRIAVFYQADAYGRSGWDGVRKELAKNGLDIVAEATYKRGQEFDSSFEDQVQILKRSKPDAIISIGAYEASAGFIRDARDSGLDVPIANVSFVGSESMLELLLEAGEETQKDYTKNLINSEVVPNFRDSSIPVVKEFAEIMSEYTPVLPNTVSSSPEHSPVSDIKNVKYGFVSFEGFLNAKLITQVLERLGDDLNKNALKKTVQSMSGYDIGLGETVSFSADDNQALSTVYFNTVVDRKFMPISDWGVFKK